MSDQTRFETGLIDGIRKNARVAVVMGIVMVICGVIALGSPAAAGLSVTIFVGMTLVVGGIAQCFLAFRAGAFGKGLLNLLVGALTAIAGFLLISQPVAGLASITIVLAAYFIVSGLFELVAAFQARPHDGWGMLLFNGIVTLVLGLMIWNQFPFSGAWAVGLLFGVKLIMSGWSLIFIGRSVRGATGEASSAG